MTGCWELTAAQRTVEEAWSSPRGGTMLGTGRTVRDGQTVDHEFVLIRVQDGKLAYEAHPAGQSMNTFVASRLSEQHVVFEDAAHDYPQQVGYERRGDSLLAWIDGTINGQPRRVEFPYKRVGCS